jgi:beta-lactamase regulating signal transducer with metallopeptidase domain
MDRAIVEYLANALWQVPLLVGAVAAVLWAWGADVRTRHRVWLAVLAAAMLLPLRGMETLHASAERVILVAPAAASVRAGPSAPAAEVDLPVTRIEVSKPAQWTSIVIGPTATRWMARLYGCVLAFCAWRILHSWIAAQGLLRRSRSIDLAPRALAIFAQAAGRQGVALPRLRQSNETVSPVVIGARRPVLLLPAGFDRLKDDEIRAALSHEFAHLARRDYLVNLLCQIFALPLAWHPAIHYVQKRIRDTREMLCDAVAAEEMASPVRYATCLVAFALRALDGRDAALATQGLSMFDNRILEERIAQLTQPSEQPDPSTRLVRLAGASLGLVFALIMALLFHVTPTWAETPVQLTPPQVDLPAVPAAPAAPAAPPAPTAPAAPPAPAQPRHVQTDDDMSRSIATEARERAREQAQRQRERARELAERERERADRQREAAEEQRQAAEQEREEARQAMEEARREAVEASHAYAAEIKRQVAEAMKAGQAQDIDMDKIKREVAQATAIVDTPEFKAQMVELQAHMQQLHDNMAELREHMKELNREIEKSVNAPM